jgi:putative Mg2+ transporter-C (MgtC) family protein
MKTPELTAVDFFVRLGVAAALGIAIGFERQWRQRAAGLHTSSLVAIGSAMFALLDETLQSGDTTRIVAGIVTGVGFIAGGAILRSGANVTGLNTAATMWATSAVGALAAFGYFRQAAAGAAAIIILNLAVEPLIRQVDARVQRAAARRTPPSGDSG